MKARIAIAASLTALSLALAMPASALKYAEPEHNLKVDPSMPSWQPGEVKSEPEEELNLVGADIMDEISLGWVKIYRKQYPRLSLTMDLRASGAGAPGLVSGKGDLAPVGREMFPAEEKSFVDKYGYKPTPIRVATGSVGSLGKTASSVILVGATSAPRESGPAARSISTGSSRSTASSSTSSGWRWTVTSTRTTSSS